MRASVTCLCAARGRIPREFSPSDFRFLRHDTLAYIHSAPLQQYGLVAASAATRCQTPEPATPFVYGETPPSIFQTSAGLLNTLKIQFSMNPIRKIMKEINPTAKLIINSRYRSNRIIK